MKNGSRTLRLGLASLASLSIGLAVAWQLAPQVPVGVQSEGRFGDGGLVPVARRVPIKSALAARIVASAKRQIGTRYDASFQLLSYPMGDVDSNRGACTDVIVRALRPVGIDLQRAIHEDMKPRFAHYPQKWGAKAPNSSIDHRRVPNQIAFFKRHAQVLATRVDSRTYKTWQPGDIVYWNSGGGRLHTGIVSDGVDEAGEPFVIHNGSVCIEDNALSRWPIIGHFRVR